MAWGIQVSRLPPSLPVLLTVTGNNKAGWLAQVVRQALGAGLRSSLFQAL